MNDKSTPKLAIVRATDGIPEKRTPTVPGRPPVTDVLTDKTPTDFARGTIVGMPKPLARRSLEALSDEEIEGIMLGGHYQLKKRIGESHLGVIYSLKDISGYGSNVATFLPVDLTTDPQIKDHIAEAKAAIQIKNPHVVEIVDVGVFGSNIYLILEYPEGNSLTNIFKDGGTFSWDRAKDIIRQVCTVLVTAHNQGIVHGDINPDNVILIPRAGNVFVKVFGFGIPKLLASAGINGDMLDQQSDIRAIGKLIGSLLAKITDLKPDVLDALQRIVARTTADKDSYNSMAELDSDIRGCEFIDIPKPEIAPSPAMISEIDIPMDPPIIIKQGIRKSVVAIIAISTLVIGGVSGFFLNHLLNKPSKPTETLAVKRKPVQPIQPPPIQQAPPISAPVPIPQAPTPASATPAEASAPVVAPVPVQTPKTKDVPFTSRKGAVAIFEGETRLCATPCTLTFREGEVRNLIFGRGGKRIRIRFEGLPKKNHYSISAPAPKPKKLKQTDKPRKRK